MVHVLRYKIKREWWLDCALMLTEISENSVSANNDDLR